MFRFETQSEIDEVNNFTMLLLRRTRPHLSENQRRIIAQDLIGTVTKAVSSEPDPPEKIVSKNNKERCELVKDNSMSVRVERTLSFGTREKCLPKLKFDTPEDICRAKRRQAFQNRSQLRTSTESNSEKPSKSCSDSGKTRAESVTKAMSSEPRKPEKIVSISNKESCELERDNSGPVHVERRLSLGTREKRIPKFKFEAPEDICRAKRREAFLNRNRLKASTESNSDESSKCSDYSKTKSESVSRRNKENCELNWNSSMPMHAERRVDFTFSARPSLGTREKCLPKFKFDTPEDICRAKRRETFQNRLKTSTELKNSHEPSKCSDSGSTPRKLAGDRGKWQNCTNKTTKDCKKVYVSDISHGAPEMKKKRISDDRKSLTGNEKMSTPNGRDGGGSGLEDVFTRLCSLRRKK